MLLLQRLELIEDSWVATSFSSIQPVSPLSVCTRTKAAAMLEHLQFVAVLYRRGAVRDSRNPVTQKGLLRSDVHILRMGLWAQPGAAAESDRQAHNNTGTASRDSLRQIELSRRRKNS